MTDRNVPQIAPETKNVKKTAVVEKKTSAAENCIVANAECKAVFPASTVCRKKHGKNLPDEAGRSLPKGSKLLKDAGFQGVSVENVFTVQPTKKKKGKESASGEKAGNKNISKTGVRIEHTAGSIKRCRIFSGKSGNWARGFADMVMAVACALHNFRPESGPWQKADADDL